MKIRTKLICGFLAVAVSLTLIFYAIGIYNQDNILESRVLSRINHVKDMFYNLEERDTMLLSSTLEALVQDRSLKNVYMEKNREKLYEYGQPLFQRIRNEYGITNFYFILPDGRNFVRLHNKEMYGDTITRPTFYEARGTKEISSGIEMGKTAFALRAVMPYYNGNRLIGYMELGKEIGHFLRTFKGEASDEFAILADKEGLDREKWRSVRQRAGLRDNWDDREKHVLVGSTIEEQKAGGCFAEENIRQIEEGELILQQVKSQDKSFVCIGFVIDGVNGQHVGTLLSLLDITEETAIAKKAGYAILGIAVMLFIIASGIGILISSSISKPLLQLTKAAAELKKGNLDYKIRIRSNDEIDTLARTFNEMRIGLKERNHLLRRGLKERNALLNTILTSFKGKTGSIAAILMRKNIQGLIDKNPRILGIIPSSLRSSFSRKAK